MTWQHPYLLWLLVLVALMPVLSYYLTRVYRKKLLMFFSEELLEKLTNKPWETGYRTKQILFYLGLALLVVGMSGPKIGSEIREVKRQGTDLLIALDVSRGMAAEDIRPNRLEKAKFEIRSMVNRLQGDRVGLLLFTDTAFLQSPLTTDYAAFNMYLDLASSDQFPTQGTDFRPVLREAREVFKNSGEQSGNAARVLMFFSDGEDHSPGFDQELQALVNDGVFIYTVGIGTPQGATIPIYDRRTGRLLHYHRDREGRVVTTRLEPENLRRMAQAGRGTYYEIQRSSDRIDGFLSKLDELERRDFAVEMFSDFRNRYQIPVAAGLILILLSTITPAYKPAGRSS